MSLAEIGRTHAQNGHFLAGNNLSRGRPKGSRNKLGEAFLEDLYADWQEHGKQALVECREQNPAAYVKVIASLLPKDINLNVERQQLSDDELAAGLDAVRAAIRARELLAASESAVVIDGVVSSEPVRACGPSSSDNP